MKPLFLIPMFFLFGFAAQSQEKQQTEKRKSAEYTIAVSGNCGMCKKRIEKAAYSVKGVKSANWHPEGKDVHVIIDERKTTIEEVHKAISKAGHDTDKVKTDDQTYEKLHHCCQYERM